MKATGFVIALAIIANAQKIDTEESDQHKVIRAKTAPTTEEAPSPHRGDVRVAAGDDVPS